MLAAEYAGGFERGEGNGEQNWRREKKWGPTLGATWKTTIDQNVHLPENLRKTFCHIWDLRECGIGQRMLDWESESVGLALPRTSLGVWLNHPGLHVFRCKMKDLDHLQCPGRSQTAVTLMHVHGWGKSEGGGCWERQKAKMGPK